MKIFRSIFLQMLYREYLLVRRASQTWMNALIFFLLVSVLFPLSTAADPQLLHAMAPGVIWIAALLANFLSLPQLFQEDEKEGCLELLLLSPTSLNSLMAAKILMHWILYSLPLIIISAVLMLMFQLPFSIFGILAISLILGTGILQGFSAILAALTVCLRQSGILLALLIFPLYVPVFILGTNAISQSMLGFSVAGPLAWLSILFILMVWISPMLSAVCLRVGLKQ